MKKHLLFFIAVILLTVNASYVSSDTVPVTVTVTVIPTSNLTCVKIGTAQTCYDTETDRIENVSYNVDYTNTTVCSSTNSGTICDWNETTYLTVLNEKIDEDFTDQRAFFLNTFLNVTETVNGLEAERDSCNLNLAITQDDLLFCGDELFLYNETLRMQLEDVREDKFHMTVIISVLILLLLFLVLLQFGGQIGVR